MKKILFIIITLTLISACGSDSSLYENEGKENNIVQVGNPNIPVGTQEAYREAVIDYLKSNSYWLGKSAEGIYLAAHFNTEKMTVKILSSLDKSSEITFSVKNNGSIHAEDAELGLKISSQPIEDENNIQPKIQISDIEGNMIAIMSKYNGNFSAYERVEIDTGTAAQFNWVGQNCMVGKCTP